MSATPINPHHELTICVLGCGTMGIAILSGILATLDEMSAPKPFHAPVPTSGASTPNETPLRLPKRFIACVECNDAAKRVKSELWAHSASVKVTVNDNVASAKHSDMVILSCKPSVAEEILTEKGIADALDGKFLVSICAGVTIDQIEGYLAKSRTSEPPEGVEKCRIVRAMPNTAALIRESMTVIATPEPPLKMEQEALITWVFKKIGDVVYLPSKHMDVSTALCGSGPAFYALMLEAMADGAVAMGLPRAEAQRMAAQSMKGAASLVLHGDHPAHLRDKVSTPGGCTIGGLLVLEEGAVRGTVSRAVREATVVASQLGKGVQGVNGTRFNALQ